MKERKTPEYTLRAQKAYRDRNENLSIVFPRGTKDRIRKATSGGSVNGFIRDLVYAELERLENMPQPGDNPE